MEGFLQNILGGGKKPAAPAPSADDAGFADFAGAPDPSPASISPSLVSKANMPSSVPTSLPSIPYTKWYRVWERTTIKDFYNEMIILPFVILIVLIHIWGTKANRRKAKQWMAKHAPVLQQEFAVVGFGGRRAINMQAVQSEGLLKAQNSEERVIPEEMLKENAPNEYATYATGRQNVAFLDVKLTLLKRYNPLIILGETIIGFFFESMPATEERVEATAYAFDGKENQLVPAVRGEERKSTGNSTYDGFVWAVVNKDIMKRLRDDRYDLSLTTTKDHPKLPPWATVMSESSEITETLLTPELVKAIHEAGDVLDALVVSDQPIDRPKKLDECVPRKRVTLALRLSSPSPDSGVPLFQCFLRLPDFLVSHAKFRPEVLRRVRGTREEEIRKIKKVDEDEKAEERKGQADKEKKEKREAMLKNMSAEDQKKFLEREREKEQRRSQKRRTMRA